ncbi:LOW QUALITY PROTEIN: centrosome-associated protein ALMS1 [Erethizon dorsatum]
MEPEDLPWPGELEEEEEEEGEKKEEEKTVEAAAAAEEPATSVETVTEEEVEAAGRELDSDSNYEFQPRESSEEEDAEDREDEEAKAWLQARPRGISPPPPPPPKYSYARSERTCAEKVSGAGAVRAARAGTAGAAPRSRPSRCPSDKQRAAEAAAALAPPAAGGLPRPLKTESWQCLPQEIDSSQTLDASQMGINVKLKGNEVTNFPSLEEGVLIQSKDQVKEPNRNLLCSPLLVIQDSFASPDLPLLTCLTQDQEFGPDSLFHQSELDFAPLRGIPDNSEDTEWFSRPSEVSEALFQATLEVPSDFNSGFSISQHSITGNTTAGALCSFLSSKQENNEDNITDTVDELKTPKDYDNYDTLYSLMSWKTQKDIQQPESIFANKDQVSVLSDTSDESGDLVSFLRDAAPHNKMSYSFLRCLLERRGRKGVPLTSDSHYFKSDYLRAQAENELKQSIDSLEGYERNEGLQKELCQRFKQKETRNSLLSSEIYPNSEIECIRNFIVPGNCVKVSEAHMLPRGHRVSKMESSGGPLQTAEYNLNETSKQLRFQEERDQTAFIFDEKNVDATENVAFEAVIASSEPSKKENTVSEIQTDISKSLKDESHESEPENPDLSPLTYYNDESSLFDMLKHPQSTPGVFEPAASEPLLHKVDDDASFLYWYPNLKSPPNTPQKMLIKLFSIIPELKSSAFLSEKSYSQAVGLGKTQSALFQCDLYNEPFLPIGKIKSVPTLDLSEKVGSSNFIYSMKVSASDSLVSQDLKQQICEEVEDSSDYNLGKDVNSSDAIQGPPEAVGSSFSTNFVACDANSEDTLPLTGDVSLITVGQETLLKANRSQGEILWPMGAESCFTIHTIMQNDSCFVEGLQGKADSDVITLDNDTECCSLDERAVVCSERVAELRREPTRESEHRSSNLRMLRFSPDTMPKSLKHLSGDTSREDIVEIIQPKLQSGITTSGDSDIGSHLSLSPEDLPQLAASSQKNTTGQPIGTLNQKALPDSHQTAASLKVSHITELPDQKTGLPTELSTSYSHGEKPSILYQESLPDGLLTDQSLTVSAVLGPADQKTETTVPSSSYSHKEKPSIFYQQELPGSYLTEEAPKVSAVPGAPDQKTGIPTVSATSYSHRKEPGIFYQQELPGSHLTEGTPKVSGVPGPPDQKSRAPHIISTSYLQSRKPSSLYQEGLPDGHLSEQSLKVSAVPGSANQKTGTQTITSPSYSQRDKPDLFYQQALPDNRLTEETLKVSVAPKPAEQKTGITTVSSTSYSHGEKSHTSNLQALPESHLTDKNLKVLAIPGLADQEAETVTVSSTSNSLRENSIFYQQELPQSPLTEETLKISTAPGPDDLKTGILTTHSGVYLQREKPGISYQQTSSDSYTTKEPLKVSAFYGLADQKTGIPAVSSVSHSHREKPSVFYQQELPDSHPTEKSLEQSVVPGPADQKTRTPTVTSVSYSHREKPVSYQQVLSDSQLPEETLKVSAISGPADQISGIPILTSASYSSKEKPSILYQYKLLDSNIENALKVSSAPEPAEQRTGTPTVSSAPYSQIDRPGVFYKQALLKSQQAEDLLKVSSSPGPDNQKGGISTVTSTSASHRKEPGISSQQELPESYIPRDSPKVSASPRPADQKTGTPTGPSDSYSLGEKPVIFYQPVLPGSHLPEEALKVLAASGTAEQKTGTPARSSGSYSFGEKPIIFYQQSLPDAHQPKGVVKVFASPEPADLKTEKSTISPTLYSLGEKPIFYQQALPDSELTKEGVKISSVPKPPDQKTGISTTVTSSSYSDREKNIISYQQELPDSRLTEKSEKVSLVPGPVYQKTEIPTVPSPSYSKPSVSYEEVFPGLNEDASKVLGVLGPAEKKTGIQIVSSTPYSNREKPVISSQQVLSGLNEEALKVLGVPRPSDQKSGIYIVPSPTYSQGEQSFISYQPYQELPHLPEVASKTVEVSGPAGQKPRIQTVSSASYSHGEQPSDFHQQESPNITEDALGVFVLSGTDGQKFRIPATPLSSYSHKEKRSVSSLQELPDSYRTEEALKISDVFLPAEQKAGKPTGPSSSSFHRVKPSDSYQQALPGSDLTEESLKASAVPRLTDQTNKVPTLPSSFYSHEEKPKISAVNILDDQKTELPTTTPSSYLQKEKPKISTVIGLNDQTTPSLTVFHGLYSQGVKPQEQLPDRDQSGDTLKISTVPEPTYVNTGIPVPLSGSYLYREKFNTFYPQELPDRYLTKDALKVSTIPEPADQKMVLPASPATFSYSEKRDVFHQKDVPGRHLTEDALKVSPGLRQADQITELPRVSPGTYFPDERHKLVSEHVQRLIHNLNSSDSSVRPDSMPLNSQVDDGVVTKPEYSGVGDTGSEEIRGTESSSKTLKEIQTLLMEAENIALKRCNFSAPLIPFRDVNDISFIQSKKVVCFKEPSTVDISNGDILQREPFTEENPNNRYIQKDIGTQTSLKCQRGIENWEFISSTTIRNPLQEAESKARVAFDETLRQYEVAKSVLRSEPEGYSGTAGNKIIIPMMTIIKSESSSDASDGNASCSWDSNLPESLESVSDVLLNFFPYASSKASLTDSREEEGVSESEDGGCSVDSLGAHVRNLLQCESSLNHAKQILRNAEEEEYRVRTRAWNLKFNLADDHGYSISELNEDDRRKVEEIKAKLFGHGRTPDLCEGLQSPRGIGCTPEPVCGHIIIESHEKGCFRTLTAEQPQLDSHSCVFRSTEPSEVIRGRRCPSPWRARHINFSKSVDQNNSHFKVWNSLQLQSHSQFHNSISKGFQMPSHEKTDPWLSELVEPACVDFHSSAQIPIPEPMRQFTTSITFSSHRHSKCISDSSVFKVGVTESSQGTGASVGVFNSNVIEEHTPPRDLKQKTSSPSSLKTLNYSPDKDVTIVPDGNRQSEKSPVDLEHCHQEEKLLERSNFKVIPSKPSSSANCSNFKEVQFSDNHTLISMSRPNSTLGVKEKNITPDLPSLIFLEQRELFEQSKDPHADHHVRKHHSPPCPNVPSCIFLEQRKLFEQSKPLHIDHERRENHSSFPHCQDYIASDLSSSIFLEQHQSKAPSVEDHMKKDHFPLSQGQDCVVEKNKHTPKPHISNINVEAKFNNVISQLSPDHYTLATSASAPPSNRKALSCVRITLCPKTPSKLDSGTLDKRFYSLDPASKTRMNSEFNSDLQTISSRSLEPTSKLLTGKSVAQNLGPKSPLDFQVVQSPLPDSNTIAQELNTVPSQNSQITTSREIQVNISDLEGYSKPEGTPVSADRSPEQNKNQFSAFSGKLSSDAVTQITTESPEKTMFSSEIFINAEDHGHEILEPTTQKLQKVPVRFASSSSVQQITSNRGTDAQPILLPYKPSGSPKMYYVLQLQTLPPVLDSKSDTTIESSHSGSNDAIAPDFPAQVLGTRDDDLPSTVNIKHKEGIYSKRAVTKASLSVGKKTFRKDNAEASVQVSITGDENLSDKTQKEDIFSQGAETKTAWPEEKESLQKDTAGSSDAAPAEHSAQVQDTKVENLPDTKATKKNEIDIKGTIPKEAWTEEKESLHIDISESECHSEFENTTHSVFRSAKFYFHHPVHLPSDLDTCHESLGRSVFMRQSWKDFFQHHSDKHKEHTCLSPPYQSVDKTKTDYTRIKSLSINVNLGDKEVIHTTKSQGRDHPKSNIQITDSQKDGKITSELTTQHTVSLNELWNKYQQRRRQQKPPGVSDRTELSLVERLDRLAKLLQSPITNSLQASESTQDDSRGEQDTKEWSGKQQQPKSKLQKKQYKSPEKGHKNIGDLKKHKVLSAHQTGGPNQIKIEQIKFDKYILKRQPCFNSVSNTSSDSVPSEESGLLTDTPTNIPSTTTSVDSDILTQTDREVALHERSSSISTIDTARLIQAFGQERVCLSPRQIKLYSSITNQQRRYLEKRCKHNRKAFNTGHPQMTSEHTRRRRIQVAHHVSSDPVSSASSFLSLNSTLCNEKNGHMLNKGIQAGNLEIVTGAKKHTRDVGVTFPTPSSSEARLEEDSDVTSWSEEKIEEKKLFTNYLGDKKLRKNKPISYEGVSWFVPVENVKSGSKKENLPKIYGPGISWFEPVTKTKPWREPLREKNWQGQRMDGQGSVADRGRADGRGPPRPFVKATLQESLQLHRPDFISRSGERIKRLKLIVQERKLQNMLQSERDALFNTMRPLPRRVVLAAQKKKPIGKKEMIQRSKRIYEQLPEVQKKREEEKRRSEYKSYRLRAQLYKKKVTNQLLGRKVPWD